MSNGGLFAALRRLSVCEPPSDLPRLLTLPRAAKELGIAEKELMALIAKRRIRTVKCDGRRKISRSAVLSERLFD